jgi:hypothetical protein
MDNSNKSEVTSNDELEGSEDVNALALLFDLCEIQTLIESM